MRHATVTGIYRYPVKGLTPETMGRVSLAPGACLPHDRRFALARAATRFDPQQPAWLHKSAFFMLMRDGELARLRTRFDEQSELFTVMEEGHVQVSARLTEVAGRRAIEAFFTEYLKHCSRDVPPRLVSAPGHAFADARRKPGATTDQYVSIVNLASVSALAQALDAPVDPLRFRANFYVEGLPAWTELDWIGVTIVAGSAQLRGVSAITRCAATNVDPATGERDLDIPATLQRAFGHNHMGIYAEVGCGGTVATGDALGPAPVSSAAGNPRL